MSGISTHILDTARGKPAIALRAVLEKIEGDSVVTIIGHGSTDREGRIRQLLPDDIQLKAGTYRLTFDTGSYFAAQHVETFYPTVSVLFSITDEAGHYHVPLLLSPFGYSTYRGT